MREAIIISDGINGEELSKSLALTGKKVMNLRFLSTVHLADRILLRLGDPFIEDTVDEETALARMYSAVKGVEYFEAANYSDVLSVFTSLRSVRRLITASTPEEEEEVMEEALKKGPFQKKNLALIEVYKRYRQSLYLEKKTDVIDVVRRAIGRLDGLEETERLRVTGAESDYVTLKEYPVQPLTQRLLDAMGRGMKEVSLSDLFETEKSGRVRVVRYRNNYGIANEVEDVIETMYKEGMLLDDCTVALTNPARYVQMWLDYVQEYKIPVTFGCGIPVFNSGAGQFLTAYRTWCGTGYFGRDSLKDLVFSEAFDRRALKEDIGSEKDYRLSELIELCGNLRLGVNAENNAGLIENYRLLSLRTEDAGWMTRLARMGEILAQPCSVFLNRYCKKRKGSDERMEQLLSEVDEEALEGLVSRLECLEMTEGERFVPADIIKDLLVGSVCAENSRAGYLHITDADSAIFTARKNLFIQGMASSMFPGVPKENYLILDADYECISDWDHLPVSKERIRKKNRHMEELAILATDLGERIYVSFPGLNVSELKEDSPSSMIYRFCRMEAGREIVPEEAEKRIEEVEYFEPALSAVRKIGESYNERRRLIGKEPETYFHQDIPVTEEESVHSPTSIETYFSCPRKYYYQYILRTPDPGEVSDMEIMTAAERGTLLHSLMKRLREEKPDKDTFLSMARTAFDDFITEKNPLVRTKVAVVRREFMRIAANAYEMKNDREVLMAEKKVKVTDPETGLIIGGTPDCVERLDDGRGFIVDYKTGSEIGHDGENILTSLQVSLYAYILELEGYRIGGGEYRYPAVGDTVPVAYDEERKKQVIGCLKEFSDNIKNMVYPTVEADEDGADPCIFCGYRSICRKGEI